MHDLNTCYYSMQPYHCMYLTLERYMYMIMNEWMDERMDERRNERLTEAMLPDSADLQHYDDQQCN